MKYRISEAAEDDLFSIAEYGDIHYGEAQSDLYGQGLEQRFAQIAEQPYLYQSVDHIKPGYRRSNYRAHQIYYRMTDQGIEIMRIIGKQNFP